VVQMLDLAYRVTETPHGSPIQCSHKEQLAECCRMVDGSFL
jgi:hypothetical protein